MVGWISPNVEDGVAAPGTPGLGEFFGAFGGDAAKIIAHGNVFLGKSIGPAQGAHGNVMGGPLADAGEFRKALDGVVGIMVDAVVEGEFAACVVQQVFGIRAIDHGERFRETERLAVQAQQTIRNRVKRAAPHARE